MQFWLVKIIIIIFNNEKVLKVFWYFCLPPTLCTVLLKAWRKRSKYHIELLLSHACMKQQVHLSVSVFLMLIYHQFLQDESQKLDTFFILVSLLNVFPTCFKRNLFVICWIDALVQQPSSEVIILAITSWWLFPSWLITSAENSINEHIDLKALCLKIKSSDDISYTQCDKMSNTWSSWIV